MTRLTVICAVLLIVALPGLLSATPTVKCGLCPAADGAAVVCLTLLPWHPCCSATPDDPFVCEDEQGLAVSDLRTVERRAERLPFLLVRSARAPGEIPESNGVIRVQTPLGQPDPGSKLYVVTHSFLI